ncbi:MAG: hypothetical protein HOO96_00705 [Polyangiaceae bacterium]|nr:hypothetical protein [Polyangiaceae bacterium]
MTTLGLGCGGAVSAPTATSDAGPTEAGPRDSGSTVATDAGPSAPRTKAQVSTRATHACAIDPWGVLRCWGDNSSGQLGVGLDAKAIATPTVVDAGHAYRRVSAGINATCAIRVEGSLHCWGDNAEGTLLDGTTENRSAPVRIGSETDWEAVTVGWRVVCGIRDGGKLFCWQKGEPRVVLSGGPAIHEVSLNYYQGLALDARGQSYLALLSEPTPLAFNYAAAVPVAAHVAAPVFGALAIDASGRVVRWTRGFGVEYSTGDSRFVAVAGSYSVVAVATDGTLHIQVTEAAQNVPLALRPFPSLGTDWVDVEENVGRTACGVRANGSVWCFDIAATGEVGAPREMVHGR